MPSVRIDGEKDKHAYLYILLATMCRKMVERITNIVFQKNKRLLYGYKAEGE